MRPHTYLLEDKVRKHSNCLGIIALGHVMETERAYTDKGTFRVRSARTLKFSSTFVGF